MMNRTANLLDDPKISPRVKIAAAWASFMFLYVYVDVLNFFKPGVVDDILRGVVFEFAISSALLTAMLISIAIPALMVMLAVTLPARVNRVVNLVLPVIYIPYSVFNAAGETWEWALFYGISIAAEVLLLLYILRTAWAWPRAAVVSEGSTKRQEAEYAAG